MCGLPTIPTLLMGYPRHLGAGGPIELVADRAETYTLADVRRFGSTPEAGAEDGDGIRRGRFCASGRVSTRDELQEQLAAPHRPLASQLVSRA